MDKIALHQDVTRQGRLDSQLLAMALEMGAVIVMITDRRARVLYVNKCFEDETGYSQEEVLGNNPSFLKSGLQTKAFYQRLWNSLLSGQSFTDVMINRRKDGSIYYEEKTITPLRVDDTSDGLRFISIGKNITSQIQENHRLSRFVNYDPVTDLPNRMLFTERLRQAIAYADTEGQSLALIYLNLHRFRRINETLGYESGDKILRVIGERLTGYLGKNTVVGRLSGDNFAFIVENEAVDLLEFHLGRIFALFSEAIECCGHEVVIDVSIGISLYPDDGDAGSLIEHAEMAMMKARTQGLDQYQFYTSDLGQQLKHRLSLESELRRALEYEEFVLYYQPQVSLKTRAIIGCEALLRWQHPERGIVGPNEFIDLLEESGLISAVGNWVIEKACEDFKSLLDAGIDCGRFAVNLSALQFNDARLPFFIQDQLDTFELDPCCLELEITEGIMMSSMNRVMHTLNSLSDMGLRLSIDDFGTGFSSLHYLKRIPVDALKLALPFVQGLPVEPGDVGISRAVIALAHNLDLEVVAEGVETDAQLGFLEQEGCDVIQGYLFSRPISLQNLETLMNSGKML